ncbi:UDP-N-acetylmuramoyl-L-alanyl-D-glutamate--2,6-diaminopimelate ligase, partial [candidate division WOR-3 bacterium]|nr:UDP-N-acetylmuramoyl-L-alanyl-D-glutamate--2,6-diaminopimelate ligase [candidate division WOR-3 bacterium]
MHPDKLLNGVEIIKRQGEVDFILGVTDNSREVEPDYLFVALKGEKEDGHNYLDEARANGAKFLVLEEEVSTPLP